MKRLFCCRTGLLRVAPIIAFSAFFFPQPCPWIICANFNDVIKLIFSRVFPCSLEKLRIDAGLKLCYDKREKIVKEKKRRNFPVTIYKRLQAFAIWLVLDMVLKMIEKYSFSLITDQYLMLIFLFSWYLVFTPNKA